MIPKKIHLTWKTKDILQSEHPLIVNGVRRLIEMNPDWKVEISDDAAVDDYLRGTLRFEDYGLMRDVHIVAKGDLWRLFKMYNEGGLYIDIDRLCNVNLNEIATEGIRYVLPTCRDYDFTHDFMMSDSGNPVFLRAIELVLGRRREGNNNTYFLGAQTYMHAITQVLFGEMINTDPGEEVFTRIREVVKEKMPFVKMYREDPPLDTIVYKHDGSELDHEALKRDFYAKSDIKHWTGEW